MFRPFISLLFLYLLPVYSWAQDISANDIDRWTEEARVAFSIPGMAVGVIKNGNIIHARGYGVRSILTPGNVDEHTYFGIASNSKGFTATALAILVDEKKINWDDPVIKYLPDFKLWDPYVTDHFTIRDLLSHATGLPLGSGDLMWWPDANYSPDEVIHNMRYLKPNRGFRTTYEYNNLPFIVAGQIIPAVTGLSYEDFLQQRIFDPLSMDRCTANTPVMADDQNIAAPHADLGIGAEQVKRYLILDEVVGSMAAAGIQCSVDDLLVWANMHLDNGAPLMNKETHDTLWQINTPIPVNDNFRKMGVNFRGYGLGYNVSDYHGHRIISHGGALIGMYSHLSMIPELDLAIAITTNQQSAPAYNFIKNKIVDFYLDIENSVSAKDIAARDQVARQTEAERLNKLAGNGNPHLPLDLYIGPYEDPWWQEVDISLEGGDRLYFKSRRSPSLKGFMEHFEDNTFIVRWDDRTHEADSFVYFSMNAKSEITGFTMKAISNRTDFSYDFHHVNMIKK